MNQPAASTAAVLQHHLSAFDEGVDAILSDYTEESVLLTQEATYRGLAEIRRFFTNFIEDAPAGLWDAFEMKRQEVAGEVAYIVWEAKPWILLATDTYVIRDGKIAYQTFAAFRGPVR